MRICSILGRVLVVCAAMVGGAGRLAAQSYQSSFSEVKFDRAKGPATFVSGVQVDAASGAASMEIPCGPGIGERGLRFRPNLSIRIAPQLGISNVEESHLLYTSEQGVQTWGTQSIDTIYQRGYGSSSFSPGTFDLALWGALEQQSTYSLPGGGGGSILGTVPPGMTVAAAQQLLARFGVSGTIGTLPTNSTYSSAPFIQMGSSGNLILGLNQPGNSHQGTDEVQDWFYTTMVNSNTAQYRWPRRLLVIQGDVAYEFAYVSHRFVGQLRPYITNGDRHVLNGAHYVVKRILNRFGENITFDYDADGIGYTATWSTNPSVKIRVQVVGTTSAPAMPCLSRTDYNLAPLTQVRVSYQGISQPVSSFLLELGSPEAAASLALNNGGQPGSAITQDLHGQRMESLNWGEAALTVQPVRIVQEATNETIQFSYVAGPSGGWNGIYVNPTVLSAVTFPNRVVSLNWEVYAYKPNYSPNSWGSFYAPPRRPAWAYGVKQITDTDTVSGSSRTTTHARVVPQLNWLTYVPQGSYDQTEVWVSRDFYTAITAPDGQIALHRFTEPDTNNGTTGEAGMRSLAYLKHIEREVRYYEPGADWRSDLTVTSPASSSAYRWVVKDRFSTHGVGNPTGSLDQYAVPYPTRTRNWDRDSRTFGASENTTWDPTNLGWTQTHRTSAITAAPSLGVDILNLASKGWGYTSPGATSGTEDLITKTLDSKVPEWLMGRVSREETVRQQDNTGSGTTVGAQPLVSRVQDPVFNTLKSVTAGDPGGLAVVTTLNYQGASGLAAAKLSDAKLSSPQGLTGSGAVGVDSYGYDENGFLNSINIRANASTLLGAGQTQDEIGRPKSQSDAEGRIFGYGWDGAGRLNRISPPGSDYPTVISYNDSDHRGVTLSRGSQVQEFRYNGFGELVLERRQDPNGAWSHRVHGFDAAGRSTGETVWLSGPGYDHEAQWTAVNLTRSVTQTVTIPGTSVCKRWGPINPDTGERDCIQWQTTPPTTTTTTLSAIYTGSSILYDGRGRVQEAREATGVTATTSYPVSDGFLKVVTVGGTQTTRFLHDAVGRLKRVTDAKNQLTDYVYDASNRVKAVTQYDGLGHAQGRSWNYNSLGWLESLVQPESGTTSYSGFTIMGKAQATSYNGRVVRTAFDFMGRVTDVWSDDGTMSQGFGYDTAAAGKGKPAWNRDGSVTTGFGYDSATGRLTGLTTTAAGQTFTQTFGYDDGYGNRTSGNTSHAGWSQSFHPATGLPRLLSYGPQTIADTSNWAANYDVVSWMPKAISYGNGASSSFAYGADQARLSGLDHFGAGGTALERWGYQYDGAGNLIQELDKRTGLSDTYAFDSLNRLVGATIQSASMGQHTQVFDYDAFGNRITGTTSSQGTVAPTTANLSLNPGDPALYLRNQLPAQMTSGAYTGAVYDAQGNLTRVYAKPGDTGNVLTMAYDALGRVTSVTHSGKGVGEVYQYRADGLRTVIDDYRWGTYQKTRIQVYNDARQLVSQYEKTAGGALAWKKDILYLGTREAAEIDAAGMHVTQVDHLGSPRVVTGPSGQVESRQKYLPFGELLEQSGTILAKGYTGHEKTDESGLIYMQARFYIPWYGRFASPDPARDQHFEMTQSWNISSYVQNNPVNHVDPTGMIAILPDDDKTGAGMNAATAYSADGNMAGQEAAINTTNKKAESAQTGSTSLQINTSGDLSKYSSNLGGALTTSGHDVSSLSLSDAGRSFISSNEGGDRAKVYLDSMGFPTAGVGHLLSAGENKQFPVGSVVPEATRSAWFSTNLNEAQQAVNSLVTQKLFQHEYDALVDFAYHMGAGNLGKSNLLKDINAGHLSFQEINNGFHGWNLGGPGVPARRDREVNLFYYGVYP